MNWNARFPLEPTAYGRSRIAMRGGKPRPFKPAKTRKAMDELKLFIANANPVLFDCAIQVEIMFTFVRPKSVSENKRPYHTVKPDVDNLCKTVFDAGTGILWHDDTQIVELIAGKRYGERNEIEISVKRWVGIRSV